MKNQILFIGFLFFIQIACPQSEIKTINPQIPPPNYHSNPITLTNKITTSDKTITMAFPDINFEISGMIYTSRSSIQNLTQQGALPHDKSIYDNSASTSCQFYGTSLSIEVNATVPVSKKVMKHYLKGNHLYLINGKSQFMEYTFNMSNFHFVRQILLDQEIASVNDGSLTDDLNIIKVSESVLIFTSNSGWSVISEQAGLPLTNNKYFNKIQNFDLSNIRKVGQMKQTQNKIWISTDMSLHIYKVTTQNQITKLQQLKNLTEFTQNEIITDVHYDILENKFHVLLFNKLIILSPNGDNYDSIIYQLDGEECSQVVKFKSTVYVVCEYERVNFVAELQVMKDNTVNLNRYYDDSMIEGIQSVEILNYDKIALIGDEEVLMIGEGVNRNTLLELLRVNKIQTNKLFYSFGLIDVYSIPEFSNKNVESILAVNYQNVQLYTLYQEPPEVQCTFNRDEVGPSVSLLVAFNTTHCPYSNQDPTTVGGTETLCQTVYPFEIQIGIRQLQNKKAKLIMVSIILLIGALSIIFVGFGIQIKNGADKAIINIRQKLQKLKNKKQQELKKI